MDSKVRNFLRSEANKLEDVLHVGKDGVNDNLIKQAKDVINKRELIKGKILNNSLEDVNEVGELLAKKTGGLLIATIGSKFIIYKKNSDINRYNL